VRTVDVGSTWSADPACTKGQVRNWLAGHRARGGGPDEPEEKFVAANEAGGGPGGDGGAMGPWDQPWARFARGWPRCPELDIPGV
jgi:hypothetical protein